jgi:phosphoglycolate phosphatase-like HAD superfamily hydrolase
MIAPNRHAKLWLFDFDNTLAALEREVDWAGSRRELEAYLRAEGADSDIFTEIPKGNLPLYSALHSRLLRGSLDAPHIAIPPLTTAEAILRRASEIIERYELIGAERAAPTPGAISLLEAIAERGAVAAIVTSNSSRTVTRWLKLHRIGNLVRAIVGRDSLLALKPSPEMIVHALALSATFASHARSTDANSANTASALESVAALPATNAPATASHPEHLTILAVADAVFVGDSEADFGAAIAAGLGFYGIATTESARHRLIAAGATDIFASPAAVRIHLNLAPAEPT